jgi:hypothetical protein
MLSGCRRVFITQDFGERRGGVSYGVFGANISITQYMTPECGDILIRSGNRFVLMKFESEYEYFLRHVPHVASDASVEIIQYLPRPGRKLRSPFNYTVKFLPLPDGDLVIPTSDTTIDLAHFPGNFTANLQ